MDAVGKKREGLNEDGLAGGSVEDLEADGARRSRFEEEGAVSRGSPGPEILAGLAVARDPRPCNRSVGSAHDAAQSRARGRAARIRVTSFEAPGASRLRAVAHVVSLVRGSSAWS